MADIKDEMVKNQEAMQDMVDAVSNITIEAPEIPEIRIPEIRVPEPRVTVNTPAMKMPDFKFPEQRSIFSDVNFKNPLPVILTDIDGRPYSAGSIMQMGGGGGFKMVNVGDIKGAFGSTNVSSVWNADNRLRVSLETGGSGLTDSELRASSVPVSQVSGAVWSTNIADAFGSTAVTGLINADNRIRVSLETGGSGLTDSELRASGVPVSQVSGANWSTSVVDIFGSTAANIVNPDGRLKVELPTGASGLTDTELRATAVPVSQLSGAVWSTAVIGTVVVDGSGVTQPVSATDLDIRDLANATDSVRVYQLSGAIWSTEVKGTVTVDGSGVTQPVSATDLDVRDLVNATDSVRVYQLSGASWSTEATVVGSLPTGSNTIGAVTLSGALTSAVVTGPVVADAVDDGSAPVQSGGIARTANPTAVGAGDVVKSTHDDLGRQVFRVHQVRDLISTARVTISTGTETTLLAAVAGSYLDMMSVMCANNSDAAVSVDFRAVTAGNVVQTIQVPANGTAGWAPQTPWPQDETGNNWTADLPDITGTTISISALFSREV